MGIEIRPNAARTDFEVVTPGEGTQSLAAALAAAQTESEVNALIAAAAHLALSGGTMLGSLILAGAPTIDLEAATKKYVDDEVAGGGGGGFRPVAHQIGALYGMPTLSGSVNYSNVMRCHPMLLDPERTYTVLFANIFSTVNDFVIGVYSAPNGFPETVETSAIQTAPAVGINLVTVPSYKPTQPFHFLVLGTRTTDGDVFFDRSGALDRGAIGWTFPLHPSAGVVGFGWSRSALDSFTIPDPWTEFELTNRVANSTLMANAGVQATS